MKSKLFSFLKFIHFMDSHDDTLSLTSIALIVVIVKIAMVREASIADLGALATALLAYSGKKMIPRQVATTSQDITDFKSSLDNMAKKLEDVENKASGLAVAAGLRKMGN